jgi:hypothetical protein
MKKIFLLVSLLSFVQPTQAQLSNQSVLGNALQTGINTFVKNSVDNMMLKDKKTESVSYSCPRGSYLYNLGATGSTMLRKGDTTTIDGREVKIVYVDASKTWFCYE